MSGQNFHLTLPSCFRQHWFPHFVWLPGPLGFCLDFSSEINDVLTVSYFLRDPSGMLVSQPMMVHSPLSEHNRATAFSSATKLGM